MHLQYGVLYSTQGRKVVDCEIKYNKADNSKLTIPLGITGLQ